MYRLTQIIACRRTGPSEALCLVHTVGWVRFTGRAVKKMPPAKFKHLRSKLQPGGYR